MVEFAFVTNRSLRPPSYWLWLEFQFCVSPLLGQSSGRWNEKTGLPVLSGLLASGTRPFPGSPSTSRRPATRYGNNPRMLSNEWFSSIRTTTVSIWRGAPGAPTGSDGRGNEPVARSRRRREVNHANGRDQATASPAARIPAAPKPPATKFLRVITGSRTADTVSRPRGHMYPDGEGIVAGPPRSESRAPPLRRPWSRSESAAREAPRVRGAVSANSRVVRPQLWPWVALSVWWDAARASYSARIQNESRAAR